jgi:hypothetical protein
VFLTLSQALINGNNRTIDRFNPIVIEESFFKILLGIKNYSEKNLVFSLKSRHEMQIKMHSN